MAADVQRWLCHFGITQSGCDVCWRCQSANHMRNTEMHDIWPTNVTHAAVVGVRLHGRCFLVDCADTAHICSPFCLKCDVTQPRHEHHVRRYTCLPGPGQKVGQQRGLVLIKLCLLFSKFTPKCALLNTRILLQNVLKDGNLSASILQPPHPTPSPHPTC